MDVSDRRQNGSMPIENTLTWTTNTFHSIPNELVLSILRHLPLKSLIAARGVSRQWREFTSLSLCPARFALLQLYLEAIESPAFTESRELILPHLRPWNREAYISDTFLHHRNESTPLPDEFRLWLLEWPSKALTTWIWPGLSVHPQGYLLISKIYALNSTFGLANYLVPSNLWQYKTRLRLRSVSASNGDTVIDRTSTIQETETPDGDWCHLFGIGIKYNLDGYRHDGQAIVALVLDGGGLGDRIRGTMVEVSAATIEPLGVGWVEWLRDDLRSQDESLTRWRERRKT